MNLKYVCFFVFFSFAIISSANGQKTAVIRGQVMDSVTHEKLAGVNVVVLENYIGAVTDRKGVFLISNVPAGYQRIKAARIGYDSWISSQIQVGASDTVEFAINLTERAIRLEEITVTPGQVSIMQGQSTAMQALERKDIEAIPQLGEDLYRGVSRLPGVSSNDYSSKFFIRGGEYEEALVLFDGMELIDPFHMKDMEGGAGTIVDVSTVEGVDLMTGGYTAEYGNHMSGVFKMYSRKPAEIKRLSAGLSMMNTRIMSDGGFNNSRGKWIFSGRHGYLDVVMPLIDPDFKYLPTFYDVYGKVQYEINKSHIWSVNTLYAHDILKFTEDDNDKSHTSYNNGYVWSSLTSQWFDLLASQTIGSVTFSDHSRNGKAFTDETGGGDFSVDDKLSTVIIGIKQDWVLDLSDRWVVKWGSEMKKLYADYDYFYDRKIHFFTGQGNLVSRQDTNSIKLNSHGYTLGFYVANRFRLADPFVLELGLRHDLGTYSGDQMSSPRVNVVYQISEQTILKLGWGYYYQMQGINQINVQDKETGFFEAQKSEHFAAGLEQKLPYSLQFRLDAYYKKLSNLRPSYRNLSNVFEIFPELQLDRAVIHREGGISKGLEFYLKRDNGNPFSWWASYALSKVTDHVTDIVTRGQRIKQNRDFPSLRDQRHTINLDMNYRPSPKWQINVAWQFHTGWHYTERYFRKGVTNHGSYYYDELGVLYGKRYPAFHKLDFRVSRTHQTQRHGVIIFYLEVFNAYYRNNVRSYSYNGRDEGGKVYYQKFADPWLPILPSIGVSWTIKN